MPDRRSFIKSVGAALASLAAIPKTAVALDREMCELTAGVVSNVGPDARGGALEALATIIEGLPRLGGPFAGQITEAGRLLMLAVERFGAFTGPEYISSVFADSFLPMVMLRFIQKDGGGYPAAFVEAAWWLKGKPDGAPDIGRSFPSDCQVVAKALIAQAGASKTVEPEQAR